MLFGILFGIIFEVAFWIIFVTIIVRIAKRVKTKKGMGKDLPPFQNTISNANDSDSYGNSVSSESIYTYCDYCGSKIEKSRKKCSSCGARVDK